MANLNKIPRGYANEGHLPKRSGIYLGLVRKNYDGQRMGRLLVWISDFGPDSEEYWLPVSYASSFAGATPVKETVKDGKKMEDSQQTYGWWATPPDIDNQVLCCFLDGDIASGYWFACVYPQNMNQMVPGIGWSKPTTDEQMDEKFKTYGPPTVEYNKNDDSNSPDSSSPTSKGSTRENVKRPVFTPLAEGLIAQGLTEDPQRGISNSSARRESPSRTYGLLSPRGNSIHIDDGPIVGDEENEFIRFRTRSGAQIIIHETSGYIYMITKGGNSWIEMSDGGIDMYSSGPISLASDDDVNIHAGGKVGIHGTKGIHMTAQTFSSFTSEDQTYVSGKNIYMDAVEDIGLKSSRDVAFDAVRDVSENAGRNITAGACGVVSRNGKKILDNSGGAAPVDVPRADYVRDVNSRVPRHEPFDHFNMTDFLTTVDSMGKPVKEVVDSNGSVNTVPANIPKSLEARANLLYCKLKARGFSNVQIAAILGVWTQESSLNPGAKEGGSDGQGIGLVQWSRDRLSGGGWGPGRKAKFLDYAKSKGKEFNDIDMQLDFFELELNGNEKKAGKTLKGATTLDQAILGMKQYERFGVAGKRVAYAKSFENDIAAGKYKCDGATPKKST